MLARFAGTALLFLFFCAAGAAQMVIEGVVRGPGGSPVAGATVALAREGYAVVAHATSDSAGSFRFPAMESGAYTLTTSAAGFFDSKYSLVARPRQPISLTVELTPRTAVRQAVEVHSTYRSIDPEKTGSS